MTAEQMAEPDGSPGGKARRKVGRPRDEAKEAALKAAALHLYADLGWAGFTFEAVARRAEVGKPAIYLRWETRIDLLLDALDTLDVPRMSMDTGSLKGDLSALGGALFEWWASPGGQAWLRLQSDVASAPELADTYYRQQVRRNVQAARRIAERAVERGEVESVSDGIILLEMINGAVFTRIYDSPVDRRPAVIENAAPYVERLVALVVGDR